MKKFVVLLYKDNTFEVVKESKVLSIFAKKKKFIYCILIPLYQDTIQSFICVFAEDFRDDFLYASITHELIFSDICECDVHLTPLRSDQFTTKNIFDMYRRIGIYLELSYAQTILEEVMSSEMQLINVYLFSINITIQFENNVVRKNIQSNLSIDNENLQIDDIYDDNYLYLLDDAILFFKSLFYNNKNYTKKIYILNDINMEWGDKINGNLCIIFMGTNPIVTIVEKTINEVLELFFNKFDCYYTLWVEECESKSNTGSKYIYKITENEIYKNSQYVFYEKIVIDNKFDFLLLYVFFNIIKQFTNIIFDEYTEAMLGFSLRVDTDVFYKIQTRQDLLRTILKICGRNI